VRLGHPAVGREASISLLLCRTAAAPAISASLVDLIDKTLDLAEQTGA
jgi:hypothetical protein